MLNLDKNSVVTQWTKGKIVQFFVQGGKKIEYPDSTWPGVEGHELTDEWCEAAIKAFDDTPRFNEVGGMAQMDDAVEKGMVLVMSLWDDVSFKSIATYCHRSY